MRGPYDEKQAVPGNGRLARGPMSVPSGQPDAKTNVRYSRPRSERHRRGVATPSRHAAALSHRRYKTYRPWVFPVTASREGRIPVPDAIATSTICGTYARTVGRSVKRPPKSS